MDLQWKHVGVYPASLLCPSLPSSDTILANRTENDMILNRKKSPPKKRGIVARTARPSIMSPTSTYLQTDHLFGVLPQMERRVLLLHYAQVPRCTETVGAQALPLNFLFRAIEKREERSGSFFLLLGSARHPEPALFSPLICMHDVCMCLRDVCMTSKKTPPFSNRCWLDWWTIADYCKRRG